MRKEEGEVRKEGGWKGCRRIYQQPAGVIRTLLLSVRVGTYARCYHNFAKVEQFKHSLTVAKMLKRH